MSGMSQPCRLCKSTRPLCRSHILPEFAYRPLYDEKHRYTVLTVGSDRDRYAQRGLAERLLCHDCEQQFAKYEKYASEVMTGRLGHHFKAANGRIVIRGIDYRVFKLFQMSVLWRGSVSSLDFFRLVSLGPREEPLRLMLLNEEPGAPGDFGCIVLFAHDRGESVSDTLFNPEPFRWVGRRMHKFFFAGSTWLYHCDQRPAADHLQKFFLRVDGSLMGLFGDLADAKTLFPFARRAARAAGY
jgi:hypothetical protein